MKDTNHKLTLEERVDNLEKLHFYGILSLFVIGAIIIYKSN